MPDMEYVVSTNISRIGYEASDLELHVEFTNGATYVYAQVPEFVFSELMAAPSRGSYLNRNIKGVYSYSKI